MTCSHSKARAWAGVSKGPGQGRAGPSLGLTLPMCLLYSVDRERNSTKQGKLDTCHRTRDYFVVQWPLIDFCAYETGVDHAKINSELTA